MAFEQERKEDRVRLVERRAQIVESLNDQAARRRRWASVWNVLVLLLLGLGALGLFSYRQAQKARHAAENAALVAAQAQVERELAEAERVRSEQSEAVRAEAEARRRAEAEARAQAESERRLGEARYGVLREQFVHAPFRFLSDLPTSVRPGLSGGACAFVLPQAARRDVAFVVVEPGTNGEVRAYRLYATGERESLPEGEAFLRTLGDTDFLMAAGGLVYFHSVRPKPHVGLVSAYRATDLAEAFLGGVASAVQGIGPRWSNLYFEIVFVPKAGKPQVLAQQVEYGMAYSVDKVREAIEVANPVRVQTAPNLARAFRPTVVLWDGKTIRKGSDGVTYVPRQAPVRAADRMGGSGEGWLRDSRRDLTQPGQADDRWRALYDEAVRQARLAERAAESRDGEVRETEAQYRQRIDALVREGALYFRAKVRK